MRAPGRALPLAFLALLGAGEEGDRSPVVDATTRVGLLEEQRQKAFVEASVPLLRGLLDEELRFVHASGEVATRKELIESIGSGRIDYVSIRGHDPVVRIYGGAAVVTGSAELEVRAGGGPVQKIDNLFTAVYAESGTEWRLVAYQSTRAPAP